MENSNDTGKLIGALLLGALIGGTLGILFAPDKGSETRKLIAGKTDDLTDALKEKFNSLMESAKNEFAIAKAKASEVMENGKGK